MSWTAPKTWAVGDVLTAADMNAYVRDNTLSLKAQGLLAGPQTTTTATATTTTVFIDTGLSLTLSAPGSWLAYVAIVHALSTVADDGVRFTLTDGANVTKGTPALLDVVTPIANIAAFAHLRDLEQPAAGTITRKLRVVRGSGTGNVSMFADGNRVAAFWVEAISAI